jgi:3-deoxy-D-manno-octulosonic-acid transferase
VVVPRHPERGPALVELCRSLGASARRSTVPGEGQVVIVDEIGRLAPLYRLCADRGGLAIVGGSLGSGRGGQNMLEAAAPGCCTVVGWDTRAQPDPMHLLRQADAVVELQPGTLDQQVADLVADAQRRQALGQRAQTAWLGGRGALQRTIRHLASAPPIS